MNLRINPRRTLYFFLLSTAALVALELGSLFNWHVIGFRNEWTLLPVKFFDLSTDTSVPTWFSSLMLLLCSLSLAVVWKMVRERRLPYRAHWLGLPAIFLLMSVDEVAMIHENVLGLAARLSLGETTGWLHYGWVAFGALFVLLFGLAYLRFLLHLPARTRLLFMVSGIVFVAGALGVEAFNGLFSETHGTWNLGYAVGTAVEEGCEMLGTTLFLFAILRHIDRNFGGIILKIGNQGSLARGVKS